MPPAYYFSPLINAPPAQPEELNNLPKIGFLQLRVAPTPKSLDPLADAFREGLRELGYIEGKTIQLEHRYASGRSGRLPGLVAELMKLKVDVIVVASRQAIRAAKSATNTIPIVIVTQGDPVAEGWVESLAGLVETSLESRDSLVS